MLGMRLSLGFLCFALSVVPIALGGVGGRLPARRQKREASSSGPKQPMVSVPLKLVSTGGNDLGYLVNVSVGTPAQHFQLTLDNWAFSTSTAAHIMAKNMTLENTSCVSVDVHRNLFDQSASTTFVADEYSDEFWGAKPDDSPYESPACSKNVEFDIGADGFRDTWQIGSAIVKNVPANQIHEHTPFNPEWKADGFFGLAPPDVKWDLPFNTIDQFLNAFERPLLTLYFARVEATNAAGNDNGGVMTLGGTDRTHCDSKWIGNFSDEDDACGWCFHLKSFSIGHRSFKRFNVSFPITKSAYIWAPQPVVDAVVKAIGAEYDFRSDRFLVECDRRDSMPDMVFDIRALNYSLPATDYARRVNPTDEKCTLMMKYTYPEDPTAWLLGTSFFRPYCQQIDYSTNTFKLAKALH